jgi:hypothetical protein
MRYPHQNSLLAPLQILQVQQEEKLILVFGSRAERNRAKTKRRDKRDEFPGGKSFACVLLVCIRSREVVQWSSKTGERACSLAAFLFGRQTFLNNTPKLFDSF